MLAFASNKLLHKLLHTASTHDNYTLVLLSSLDLTINLYYIDNIHNDIFNSTFIIVLTVIHTKEFSVRDNLL